MTARPALALTAALLAAPALAAPRVAVDIPPIHALVAQVMAGVGEPMLVIPPGASPHTHAMRPSEAATLQGADMVIWVGPELTPWLGEAAATLAPEARVLTLLEVPGSITHSFRSGATFEAHDHGDEHAHDHDEDEAHGHEHDDDHAHGADDHDHDHDAEETAHDHGHDHDDDDHAHGGDDHEEAAHEEDHDHDHEDHAADDHHGHSHEDGAIDPHAWLDPVNGQVWLDAIAAALSVADPANASAYFTNAAEGKAVLDGLIAEIESDLEPLRDRGFVVFHDAYQYFELRFGIEAAGAVSLGDASAPGPARIAEIRQILADLDAACVFSEPQFPSRLVATVTEGTTAGTGVLDPLGAMLPLGAALYPALLSGLRDGLVACLEP